MEAIPNFSGWATKANLKCSDGRTILADAFKHQDQTKVPLVWQHSHNDPGNVLGHAILENRDGEGVYAHGYFNDTEAGQGAKQLVEHGDITALSIYANRLVEKNKQVMHGKITELSLVLAGANPGALIDSVNVAHSDGSMEELEDEAVIYTGLPLEHSEMEENVPTVIEHADDKEKTVQEVFDTLSEDQKQVVYYLLGEATSGKSSSEVEHSDQEAVQDLFHSLDEDQTTLVTYMLDEALSHADSGEEDASDDEPTVQDIFDTLSKEQKDVVYYLLGQAVKGPKASADVAHSDQERVQGLMSELDEDQMNVVSFMIGQALEHSDENNEDESAADAGADDNDAAAHADNQEGNQMTYNAFESGSTTGSKTLSHADKQDLFEKVLQDAKRPGNTFKSALEHASSDEGSLAHGIDSIDVLFPDAKSVTNTPDWLARRSEWVADVLNGTRHTPFSRIRSMTANLTLLDARAKGYIKGNFKQEEFFKVSKRETTPQTVYKKQKLDRDDILDITDFDVVAWLKGEMRLMLDEEIARAVLLGDGRSAADEDKISEDHVRPIATDNDFYVTYVYVNLDNAGSSADEVIDALILQRRHYRGSGNPVFYTSETFLAKLLLVKDTLGRRIYSTVADLQAVLRVSKIVTVELMDEPGTDIVGIMVNLLDYTIGADRGGDVAMFDDFDIDYNQQKYLIETRLSGALTKAKSALVVKKVAAAATVVTPVAPTWNATNHSVTVPTTTGLTYKNKLTNATLSNSTPVVLTEDQELTVIAVPTNSSTYVESSANDEFLYTYEDGPVSSGF